MIGILAKLTKSLDIAIIDDALFFIGYLDHWNHLLNDGGDAPADVLGTQVTSLKVCN